MCTHVQRALPVTENEIVPPTPPPLPVQRGCLSFVYFFLLSKITKTRQRKADGKKQKILMLLILLFFFNVKKHE